MKFDIDQSENKEARPGLQGVMMLSPSSFYSDEIKGNIKRNHNAGQGLKFLSSLKGRYITSLWWVHHRLTPQSDTSISLHASHVGYDSPFDCKTKLDWLEV